MIPLTPAWNLPEIVLGWRIAIAGVTIIGNASRRFGN
jgi:hypothetical protein